MGCLAGLNAEPAESDSISRYTVSELNQIVGYLVCVHCHYWHVEQFSMLDFSLRIPVSLYLITLNRVEIYYIIYHLKVLSSQTVEAWLGEFEHYLASM